MMMARTEHRAGKAGSAQSSWGRSPRVPDQDVRKRIGAPDPLQ